MVTNPLLVFFVLLMIEGAILYFSDHPRTSFLFKYLPSMFWIYFVPMLANTAGILPQASPVYNAITTFCLPASLILLLLPVDIKAILKLGPLALAIMASGVLGVMVGGPTVLCIYKSWLGPDAWKAIGSLSASWIGGSANMIAVKEALATPDNVFLPAVIVDTIVPYMWMAMLIMLSVYQTKIDTWNRANVAVIDELRARTEHLNMGGSIFSTRLAGLCVAVTGLIVMAAYSMQTLMPAISAKINDLGILIVGIAAVGSFCWAPKIINISPAEPRSGRFRKVLLMLAIAIAGAAAAIFIARQLPVIKDLINVNAWTIIMATFLGIGISFTPAKHLEKYGASKIGFALLYFVLASIGAKANFSNICDSPVLLLAGFTWICIHGVFLVVAMRLLRAPIGVVAAASQASIGGPASAPVIAGIYQPELAPVGLLLAILGNILGTFMGLITAHLCRFFC